MAITYKAISEKPFSIGVALDGKQTGMIRKNDAGYYYAPRKSKNVGETFASVEAVKASLEG